MCGASGVKAQNSSDLPPWTTDSSSLAMRSTASATITLSTVFGSDGDCDDPSARNSNLLPVKANGLVRLRSPGSFSSSGSDGWPSFMTPSASSRLDSPRSIVSNTCMSRSPRKIEMIAGGASFAPRR